VLAVEAFAQRWEIAIETNIQLPNTGNVSNVVVCVIGTFSSQLKVCHNKM